MIVNFSQNITSKSLKSVIRFWDFTKEVRQITPLDRSWNQRLKWRDFDAVLE